MEGLPSPIDSIHSALGHHPKRERREKREERREKREERREKREERREKREKETFALKETKREREKESKHTPLILSPPPRLAGNSQAHVESLCSTVEDT